MYLNANPMLTFLLYQCMTIWIIKNVTCYRSTNFSDSDDYKSPIFDSNSLELEHSEESKPNQKRLSKSRAHIQQLGLEKYYQPTDCHILMAENDYNMPIPFFFDTKPSMIISPDRNGILNIEHGRYFRLSCVKNEFLQPYKKSMRELTVQCLNDTLVDYKNKTYSFEEFKCINIPNPKLVQTSRRCQGKNHTTVLRIGYQTENTFLNLYRICFDTKTLNPLYGWYQVKTPKYIEIQSTVFSNLIEKFTTKFSSKLYNRVNLPALYKKQAQTVLTIMKSRTLAKFYIASNEGEVRFLVPGQIINRREFPYYFQQEATFYYENTIPLWYKFQLNMYDKLNEAIQLWLTRKISKCFLVVSGAYDTFELHNENVERQKIYLYLPEKIRVPKFYWKMVYNYNTRRGLVFIALNTAFNTHIKEKRMCTSSMCPGFPSRDDYDGAFIYCCSKESFEKSFGMLDPYVYRRF